jgi:hypothetical protein
MNVAASGIERIAKISAVITDLSREASFSDMGGTTSCEFFLTKVRRRNVTVDGVRSETKRGVRLAIGDNEGRGAQEQQLTGRK